VNELPADHATSPDPAPRRQAAIVAFLGAGIEPAPSTAVLVSALTLARRAVAATHGQERALPAWLGHEAHIMG
jgi:hypothetical protein